MDIRNLSSMISWVFLSINFYSILRAGYRVKQRFIEITHSISRLTRTISVMIANHKNKNANVGMYNVAKDGKAYTTRHVHCAGPNSRYKWDKRERDMAFHSRVMRRTTREREPPHFLRSFVTNMQYDAMAVWS